MKRFVIFVIMLLIFLASCGIGYFYLNTREDQKKESKADENVLPQNNTEEYVSTETTEEKISPNTEITKETFYQKCGHEIIEISKADKDMINLTKEELEAKCNNYQIEEFSTKQVNIYTKNSGICPEHYVVAEAEGIVNIYKKTENGENEFYEATNISLEYLPKEEQEKLKSGVEAIGRENLNQILENLESWHRYKKYVAHQNATYFSY